MRATGRHLHLWIPNLFITQGGIQVYATFFFNALTALYPEAFLSIFLKNDLPHTLPSATATAQFHAMGTTPLPLRTADFSAQLIKWASWRPPHLIISLHLNFIIAAYLLKQLKKIPYWTIAHGVEAWNIQNPLLKLALRNADRILAVSHYTRDRLLAEHNLDPSKVAVLPNTFDSDRFQIAPKPAHLLAHHHLTADQPILLTVARLAEGERYKGYDQVLKALPSIRSVLPNVHYVLVGEGGDRPRLETLIAQLQLQDCVTLAGYIPDAKLPAYYQLCDVFVMPSKGEGFGIVYLEALACGKATLGGNRDGARDALCQGELGALVDPDNIHEIAQTLVQLLQGTYPNPLLYQPQALRQKAIETYGFEQFKQTLAYHLAASSFLE